MTTIDIYRKKATDVEAMQFKGWQNAHEIHAWCCDSFFVPRGYEMSQFRRKGEEDRSNGHILDEAAEFLIVTNRVGVRIRIDLYSWITKDKEGQFDFYSSSDFTQLFEKDEAWAKEVQSWKN